MHIFMGNPARLINLFHLINLTNRFTSFFLSNLMNEIRENQFICLI